MTTVNRITKGSIVRPWVFVVLTVLLLAQAITFAGLAVWCARLPLPLWELATPWITLSWPAAQLLSVVAAVLALLTLLAALGFVLLQPPAWMLASLIQGFTLATGLSLRFSTRYDFTGRTLHSYCLYGLLLQALLQVIYLNTRGVQETFAFVARQPRRRAR